jgi:hypothetical protein
MGMIPNNMAFQDFVSNIHAGLLVDSNRYEIKLILPPSLISAYSLGGVDNPIIVVQLRCNDIRIPGRSVSTLPYRQYGPARNIPYEQIYSSEIEISFILDIFMSQRKLFDNWMNLMTDRNSYKMGYYDSYVGDLIISMLDRQGTQIHTIKLLEVYPKIIGEIMVGNDKNDQAAIQDITLCYRKWVELTSTFEVSPNNITFEDSTSKERIEKIADPSPSLWEAEKTNRQTEEKIRADAAADKAKQAIQDASDRKAGKYGMSKKDWNLQGTTHTEYGPDGRLVDVQGFVNRPNEMKRNPPGTVTYGETGRITRKN